MNNLKFARAVEARPPRILYGLETMVCRSALNFSTHPPTPKNMALDGVGQRLEDLVTVGRYSLSTAILIGALLSTVQYVTNQASLKLPKWRHFNI